MQKTQFDLGITLSRQGLHALKGKTMNISGSKYWSYRVAAERTGLARGTLYALVSQRHIPLVADGHIPGSPKEDRGFEFSILALARNLKVARRNLTRGFKWPIVRGLVFVQRCSGKKSLYLLNWHSRPSLQTGPERDTRAGEAKFFENFSDSKSARHTPIEQGGDDE